MAANLDPDVLTGVENTASGDLLAAPNGAAARDLLIDRGAFMGPVNVFGDLHLCDGEDPDGNRFQLSNRG